MSAAANSTAEDGPIPTMQPTSLANQAYCTFSPYRIRDASSSTPIAASSAILLAWSQKLKSRSSSDADRKKAELLASIAKSIAADPYGDSWVPLIRHFSSADTQIPPNDLTAILRDLRIEVENRPSTDEQEIDEDYKDEDELVASIPAAELAAQVRGEAVLTDEQRKKLLGL